VIPPELVNRLREHKAELLSLVPDSPAAPVDYEAIYAELTAVAGAADDLIAISGLVDLNGLWIAREIAWLDSRCDAHARAGVNETSYRAAVLLLVARIEEVRRWRDGAAPPAASRRVIVERNASGSEATTLQHGTTIDNTSRFIARILTAVEYVLARRSSDAVLRVYLEQLAVLGVVARVETTQ
jgi:hypothetical protein